MKLEVLIFCHNFQRRLGWVLSSFLQQDSHPFDLTVDVSCCAGNGDPTTEQLAVHFTNNGLQTNLTVVNKEQLAYPSLLKNLQFKHEVDYFMCHSSDHVVAPSYLAELAEQLLLHPDSCAIGCREKVHTDQAVTDAIMADTPMLVEDAYKQAWDIERIGHRVRKGIGGHFVLNRKLLYEKTGGLYVAADKCRDRHLFNRGMRTRSDIRFRESIGGVERAQLPAMVHLNHRRDKEEGQHIEEQR